MYCSITGQVFADHGSYAGGFFASQSLTTETPRSEKQLYALIDNYLPGEPVVIFEPEEPATITIAGPRLNGGIENEFTRHRMLVSAVGGREPTIRHAGWIADLVGAHMLDVSRVRQLSQACSTGSQEQREQAASDLARYVECMFISQGGNASIDVLGLHHELKPDIVPLVSAELARLVQVRDQFNAEHGLHFEQNPDAEELQAELIHQYHVLADTSASSIPAKTRTLTMR